jgi:hypothetical protein
VYVLHGPTVGRIWAFIVRTRLVAVSAKRCQIVARDRLATVLTFSAGVWRQKLAISIGPN